MDDSIRLHTAIEQFIFREARLLDCRDYAGWEALWTDDALYWLPAGDGDIDPEKSMSIIYDNRSRLGLRVRQLESGRRHAQNPPSRVVHVISNIEVLDDHGSDISAVASALTYESNLRGETLWASRNEYRIRRSEDGLRLVQKKVVLANSDKPIFTLAFLI